ncbi:MAG: MFS transporter [Polyangiaceae bacterium]|jgi:FSR family fosmidomycin resistance protein-like MFS transporter
MTGAEKTQGRILLAVCVCHLINDMLQSLLGAIYPNLKSTYHLSFTQIGVVTLTYQLTASLLQPLVGFLADRKPLPFSLPVGTLFTFGGLLVLSSAVSYRALLLGAAVLGVGSSIFHPESSRVARMASGGRYGFAQSSFQVGGSIGGALGPLGAATVVVRWGQSSLGAFALLSLVSTVILGRVGFWSRQRQRATRRTSPSVPRVNRTGLSVRRVRGSIVVLLVLTFSKYVYLTSITSYYTFYLIRRFGVAVNTAQLYLFAFLAAVAVGTFAGGPLGDRFGRKPVIWFSILGVLPFTLAMTVANLFWTGVLSLVIGFILASAFPAIVVFGQEIVAGRVGLIAGLFYGFSFGAAGLGAAALGQLADATSITFVYRVCAFMPALGILAALLPNAERASPPGIEPAPM